MHIAEIHGFARVEPVRPLDRTGLSNSNPLSVPEPADLVLCAEIERLAQSGSHLLKDIGLKRLAALCCPAQSVWEGRGIRITLDSRTGRVLTVEPVDES